MRAVWGEIHHITTKRPLCLIPSCTKKNGSCSTVCALNQHGRRSSLPIPVALFFYYLALVQLFTLIASIPVRALGLEGEIERGRGRVPIQTLFRWLLQAMRVGKLISRYWFLTAARLLLCPRACWSAPLHLFSVHLPITSANLSLNSSLSPLSFFVLTRLVQRLIHCVVFFPLRL